MATGGTKAGRLCCEALELEVWTSNSTSVVAVVAYAAATKKREVLAILPSSLLRCYMELGKHQI